MLFRTDNEKSGTPADRFSALRSAGRYLLGVLGISLFAAVPPEADAAIAQQTLEARIEKVREALRAADVAVADPSAERKLAQGWNNWPNWGNWGNWPNWPNWGNWFNR